MVEHVKYLDGANAAACPLEGPPTATVTLDECSVGGGMSQPRQIQMYLLGIGERLRQHMAEVGHRLDFTPQQVLVLDRLGSRHTMGQLAGDLKCDPSNVTGLIRRLELRGLVLREADEADRRTKWLSLTPAGIAARESLVREMFDGTSVLDGLDDESQEQLLGYLRVVGANAKAGPDACLASQRNRSCSAG